MEDSDGTTRVTGEEFIRLLRSADEWRIWPDALTEEFVMAVKKHGEIKTYKGPDPMADQANWEDIMGFMLDVDTVTQIPEIAERRR